MTILLKDWVQELKIKLETSTDNVRFALSIGDVFVYDNLMDEQAHLRKTILFWEGFEQQLALPHITTLSEDTPYETQVMVGFREWRYVVTQQFNWMDEPSPIAPRIPTITLPPVRIGMRMSHLLEMDNPSPLVRQIMEFYLQEVAKQTGMNYQKIMDIIK